MEHIYQKVKPYTCPKCGNELIPVRDWLGYRQRCIYCEAIFLTTGQEVKE